MKGYEVIDKILNNINSVITGKEDVVELAIITLLSKGHILLEDVPGVGKTTLAKAIADTLGCSFKRIQFTPDTLPSDVTGVSVYNMSDGSFKYVEGSIMSNIVLADEINRTSPKTQSSLLEAMAEKQVTVDGITHKLRKPFMVIATQNPIDYLGTYHLLEAQLDRFFMKVSIGYPDLKDEEKIINMYLENEFFTDLKAVTNEEEIIMLQEEVSKVKVHKDIVTYILEIAKATRESNLIELGMSPRATMALIKGCQGRAYINKRDYVVPDDILNLMEPIIYHRIILSDEAKVSKMTVKMVMLKIKSLVKMPIL